MMMRTLRTPTWSQGWLSSFFEIFPDSSRFPSRRGRKFQRGERIYNVPRKKQIAHRMCAGRPACAMPKQPKRQPSSLHLCLFRSYSFQSMRWKSCPWRGQRFNHKPQPLILWQIFWQSPSFRKQNLCYPTCKKHEKGSNWNVRIQVTQFNCKKTNHATKLQTCPQFCPTLGRFDRYHHHLTA